MAAMNKNVNDDEPNEMNNTNTNTPPTNPNSGHTDSKF